jgi:hypothetical protein
MLSEQPGPGTSTPEVTNLTRDQFTLRVDGVEIVVRFDDFPWFRHAEPEKIRSVSKPGPNHLRWESLDVDLTIDALRHPDRYPLVARQ